MAFAGNGDCHGNWLIEDTLLYSEQWLGSSHVRRYSRSSALHRNRNAAWRNAKSFTHCLVSLWTTDLRLSKGFLYVWMFFCIKLIFTSLQCFLPHLNVCVQSVCAVIVARVGWGSRILVTSCLKTASLGSRAGRNARGREEILPSLLMNACRSVNL